MLIRVPPTLPGSKTATIRRWKKVGEPVKAGDFVVELEGDDALVQLQAPAAGAVVRIAVEAGKTVGEGAELGDFQVGESMNTPQGQSPSSAGSSKAPVEATASAGATGGGTPILMPQAGNTMEEGTILKWKVKVGDTVKVGQVLCEIETDKATVEMESTEAGTISWLAAEGSVIAVKQPIALLGGSHSGSSVAAAGVAGAGVATVATPIEHAPPGSPQTVEVVVAGRAGGVSENVAMPAGVVPILMPQAGNTMEEGKVLAWRVKEGDQIRVGQVICDIETDKATVEMESTDAGRLAKIVSGAGSVVAVKEAIAYLAENDVSLQAYLAAGGKSGGKSTVAAAASGGGITAKAASAMSAATAPVARATPANGRIKASPAARKLAAQMGVDLATITAGSGPEGRILSTDLAGAKATARPAPSAPVSRGAPNVAGTGAVSAGGGGVGGRRPMSKMRRAIALNLQTSKQTVPHFYVRATINADPLFAFYKAQKPATGCTLNDVMLLAVGRCVGEFAAFRSRVDGNDIVELPAANIGVAVSVADGLVVPVVMNVNALTLGQLVPEARRVVEAARNGKIENMGKGVFTISNMGMLGVEEFAAIINPPESGILAIAAVREAVVVKDGAMRPGRVMTLTLSVDHRVVDGALAAQFMARLKELLESPEKLLA